MAHNDTAANNMYNCLIQSNMLQLCEKNKTIQNLFSFNYSISMTIGIFILVVAVYMCISQKPFPWLYYL